MKFLCYIAVAFLIGISSVFAQSQYQFSPEKLTQEQENMLKRVKEENEQSERSKNLQQYRLQAKNPAKYNQNKPKHYNKSRKAYR